VTFHPRRKYGQLRLYWYIS